MPGVTMGTFVDKLSLLRMVKIEKGIFLFGHGGSPPGKGLDSE